MESLQNENKNSDSLSEEFKKTSTRLTVARQGIKSKGLIRELSNGGINRFFLARPSNIDMVATKCLRLDSQIQHHKGAIISLRLKRDMENVYHVLDFKA